MLKLLTRRTWLAIASAGAFALVPGAGSALALPKQNQCDALAAQAAYAASMASRWYDLAAGYLSGGDLGDYLSAMRNSQMYGEEVKSYTSAMSRAGC